jgi:tetratricopeptide (TPR) repeat protein
MAGAMLVLAAMCAARSVNGDETAARDALRAAFVASESKDNAAAYNSVLEAIKDPGFVSLEPGKQHAAVRVAYVSAYNLKNFAEAHRFAMRATELPQPSRDDWQYRLSSATELKDYRDEAISITGMISLVGLDRGGLSADVVGRAYRDTRSAELGDVRRQMLLALYERRWQPADGSSVSYMWRTLSLQLLEDNDAAKALQVVRLVDEPVDVIAMRADVRYKSLLKAPYFESDAHDSARKRINALRSNWAERPRSLAALLLLTHALLTMREDAEVLALTTAADRRIEDSHAGPPVFDDVDRNHRWIVDVKARALSDLGRFEDAEAEFRRAASLPHQDDAVSQAINLAIYLCELDRPQEALEVLPKMEDASDYGKTQIAFVRVAAAQVLADTVTVQEYLQYLRAHQDVSASTLQKALLIAGEGGEAEALLLSRLADPDKRTDALVDLQSYTARKLPPRGAAWRAKSEALKVTASIRREVAQVGAVGRYTWRYEPW